MTKLKQVQAIVKDVLQTVPEARDSDMLLFYRICERLNPRALSMPFGLVLLEMRDYNLPAFETVRRTRQKVQADNPDLRGSRRTQQARDALIPEFRSYAVEGAKHG